LLTESSAPIDVTVFESSSTTGGLIRATPFAGLDAIDEGADAY
jgi:protoporphyrinogen oxidase